MNALHLAPRKNLANELADTIRKQIAGGKITSDAYLPTEREMGILFKVSRVTVRRSLAKLIAEGLLETVPHKGYRPTPQALLAKGAARVAYVLPVAESGKAWDVTHEQFLSAFQRVLFAHGLAAVAEGCKGKTPEEVFRGLREAGVWGVALDTSRPEFGAAARKSGLPTVVVDAHMDAPTLDVIIQDNFNGARQAVDHLMARGRRRIGWVGPTRGFTQWRERFAGARAALWDAGRDFEPARMVQPSHSDAEEEARAEVLKMLRGPDRPDGLVCPWQHMVKGADRAVREAGLIPGRDIELVGWCNEREYGEWEGSTRFGGRMPAMLVWSQDEMAELALQRLEARAARPQAPGVRIDLPARLRPAGT